MKPIAVHLHLYYTDRWLQFKNYLQNLGDYPYELYVTLPQKNEVLTKEIKKFHPQATVWVPPNRGYDIGPFIDFLHKINLSDYDLILKIHTKDQKGLQKTWLNGRCLTKKRWCSLLLQGLLGSKEICAQNIAAFTRYPQLGLLSSRYVITAEQEYTEHLRPQIAHLLAKMGYSTPTQITFAAGTMFFVRAGLLQKVKDCFSITDFPETGTGVVDGTMSHAFERVLGCVIALQGYQISGFDRNDCFERLCKLQHLFRYFYSNDITTSNHHMIKICKIPVYYKKVN